ncbi:MAG TPA: hypothetical protein VGF28_16220 [Thermoanaerobaculia bacterium]|jgi:hypothetical protein
MTSLPLRGRPALALSIVLLAATLVIQVYGVIVRAERQPHMDENEYLHAGWLMANGGRLYETFFEHHSPFFFKTLELIAPEGERLDAKPYFVRARWLCGLLGTIALAALAALLWRIGPEVAAMGVALTIATGTLWLRTFLEARSEPFAIAFFFVGALVALRWRGAIGGVGVGLTAISCLWQPKWPLASLAIGLVWLVRSDRRIAGTAAGAATLLLALAGMSLIVPLDMWWFFNFETNVALASAVGTEWAINTYFQGGVPFLYVPDALAPWFVLPAALLLLASLRFERTVWRALPLILLLAGFLELRFVYPWPAIWAHYYVMWSVAAAAILATIPSSLAILLARTRVSEELTRAVVLAVTLAGFVMAAAHVAAVIPVRGDKAPYWVSQKYIVERVKPGETIWVESARNPVTVRSAHYYWFSIGQMTAAARELRKTARGRRYLPPPEDFPVCDPNTTVRFTHDPRRARLPGAQECMQRLIDTGQIRKTLFYDVWELRLLKSAPDSKAVKGNP